MEIHLSQPEHPRTRFMAIAPPARQHQIGLRTLLGVAVRGFAVGVGLAVVTILGPAEIGSVVVLGVLGLGGAFVTWGQ